MSTLLDRVWDLLADVALKSCLLSLAAGACLLLLRRNAASSRHLILRLLIAALLLLPLLSLVLPGWSLYQRQPAPHRQTARPPVSFAPGRLPASRGLAASSEDLAAPSVRSYTSPGPIRHNVDRMLTGEASISSPLSSPPAASLLKPPSSLKRSSPRLETHASPPFGLRPSFKEGIKRGVLILWLSGGVIALLRILMGLIGICGLRRNERLLDEEVGRLAAEVGRELGLNREVILLQAPIGSTVYVPVTWGLFRPVVLLPASLLDWPRERLRVILLHEMAHIERWDWLVQILAQVARSLYWFHPLVWWAAHRLYEEGERACDDRVLLAGVAPSDYARTLLEVVRTMKTSGPIRTLAMRMASLPIEDRLHAILTPARQLRTTRATSLLICIGALLCVLPLASLHVGAAARRAPQHSPSHRISLIHLQVNATPSGKQGEPVSPQDPPVGDRDARQLQQKLDEMQHLLLRNQKENRELRRQLQLLQAERRGLGHESPRGLTPQEQARRRRPERAAEPQIDPGKQREAYQAILRDLQYQRVLLTVRQRLAEERYRQGAANDQSVNEIRAEAAKNALHIQQVEQQLSDLEAGRHLSPKERRRRQLMETLDELQIDMSRQRSLLDTMEAQYKVGVISIGDLTDIEQRIAETQLKIDEVKHSLLQLGPLPKSLDPKRRSEGWRSGEKNAAKSPPNPNPTGLELGMPQVSPGLPNGSEPAPGASGSASNKTSNGSSASPPRRFSAASNGFYGRSTQSVSDPSRSEREPAGNNAN